MQILNGKCSSTAPIFAISQGWCRTWGTSSLQIRTQRYGICSVRKVPEAIALRAQRRRILLRATVPPMALEFITQERSSHVVLFLQRTPLQQALSEMGA